MVVPLRIGQVPSYPAIQFATRTYLYEAKWHIAAAQGWAQNLLQGGNAVPDLPGAAEHIRKDGWTGSLSKVCSPPICEQDSLLVRIRFDGAPGRTCCKRCGPYGYRNR